MTTLNQVVDGALSEVYAGTQTVDSSSYLTTAIDADDTTIVVADASRFSAGIVEIGEELILISSVNRDSGTLTTYAGGRGIRGTTAASHSIGDRVTMSPSVSRFQARQAVEETIRASAGLFVPATTTIVAEAATQTYDLPNDVEHIRQVTWDPGFGTVDRVKVKRWTHDKHAGTIIIGDFVTPGRNIHVSYAKDPTVPANFTSDFSATGLPDSCIDVIRWGTAWRLSSFVESGELLARSAEANAQGRQSGGRIRVAQYLFQMYQSRLSDEAARLSSQYPISVHFGGA